MMLETTSYEKHPFDDGRGRYPEDLKVRAPLGLRARLKRAAEEEGLTMGEFVRRVLFQALGNRQGHSE